MAAAAKIAIRSGRIDASMARAAYSSRSASVGWRRDARNAGT